MKACSDTLDAEQIVDNSPIGHIQILVTILCTTVILIDGFNNQVMGYIMPQLARVWHLPNAALGPLVSAGFAGTLVGMLFVAPQSDRIGRRRVMIVGTAWFGAMTLATSTASALDSLMTLRFLTGIGLGAVLPAAQTMIGEFCPKHRRSTFIVVGASGVTLGSLSAGVLSVLTLRRFGWPGVLWVGGGCPLVIAFLLIWALPDTLDYLVTQKKNQPAARALARRIDPRSAISENTIITTAHNKKSGSVLQLFESGRAVGTTAIWFLFIANLMVYSFIQSLMPTLLVRLGHTEEIGITVTSVFVGGGFMSIFLFGPLMDKYLPYKVLTYSFAIGGVLVSLLGGVLANSTNVIIVAAFFTGFVVLGIQKSLVALPSYFYPIGLRAAGLSWATGLARIGQTAGPSIASALLVMRWRPARLFYFSSAFMLGSAVWALVLWRRYGGPEFGNKTSMV